MYWMSGQANSDLSYVGCPVRLSPLVGHQGGRWKRGLFHTINEGGKARDPRGSTSATELMVWRHR